MRFLLVALDWSYTRLNSTGSARTCVCVCAWVCVCGCLLCALVGLRYYIIILINIYAHRKIQEQTLISLYAE